MSLFACSLGSIAFAQVPAQETRDEPPSEVDADGRRDAPQDAEAQGGVKGHMLGVMGPYTSRELYPSLMQLPDLSPEKRVEIERLARQRMDDGLQALAQSRAALTAATRAEDLGGMEGATADMRAAVAGYESGLAALRAIESGQGPDEIGLNWFKREMNLESSAATGRATVVGMTPFHLTICVLLVLFVSAMFWMYFLRMRRTAQLLDRLSQDPTFSDAEPEETAVASANPSARQDSSAAPKRAPWSDVLRVASICAEAANVKTFRLVEQAGAAIPFQYLPGQFLRLSLEIDGKPVKRAYTIASTPTRNGYVEITVKREEHGLVSRYLHDSVSVGDLLHITAPAGKFTFTGSEHGSIVLIGGGVGITPLMSVARALADTSWDREIYFLYSCRTPEEFIFRNELTYLQERNPNFRLVVTLSRESEDIPGFQRGRITKDLIASSVPGIAGRRVHVCGTPSMAKAVKEMLGELGVQPSAIKSEAFGTIKRKPGAIKKKEPVPEGGAPVATFSLSGKSGPLPAGMTILEAAEAVGVAIDNACRSGTCGSCKVLLKSGTVTMEVEDALSPEEKAAGMILGCQATSEAAVVVEA